MTNVKKTTSTAKKGTTKKSDVPKIKKVELTKIEAQTRKVEPQNKKVESNIFFAVLGMVTLAAIAILIFRLTFAYFSATIKDMNPGQKITEIESADLLVKYQDGNSNIEVGKKIEPGDILKKEFSVKNDGNDVGMYSIILENIEHNLSHKEIIEDEEVIISDFSYKLIKLVVINGVEMETEIGTGTLPFKSGEKENAFRIYIKDEVEVEQTNRYRLDLTYINHVNIDQSDSMGESFKLKVNITEYDGEMRTQDTEY